MDFAGMSMPVDWSGKGLTGRVADVRGALRKCDDDYERHVLPGRVAKFTLFCWANVK